MKKKTAGALVERGASGAPAVWVGPGEWAHVNTLHRVVGLGLEGDLDAGELGFHGLGDRDDVQVEVRGFLGIGQG